MRILIYWEQESWGGVDTQLLELLSTWPSSDDKFVLVVNQGNAGFERLQNEFSSLENVSCQIINSYSHNELNRRLREVKFSHFLRILLYFIQPLTYLISIQIFIRIFREMENFDVLLSNNGGYPAAWGCICALEAARKLGINNRFLLIHHSATNPAPFMGWYEQIIDRRVTRLCNTIVCVSQATKRFLLLRRNIDDELVRIRVIKNDIKLSKDIVKDKPVDIRKSIDLLENEYIVGMAGRITPYKGHEDLIFALSRLPYEDQKRLRVVFIGTCDSSHEESRLKSLSTKLGVIDRVHFTGYVKGKLINVIDQLDLLVVATKSFEGFGLTLIEAMRTGVPILATNVGAIPEIINLENGVLVPPNSPEDISTALADFLDNNLSWQERADNAQRSLANSQYDMAIDYRRLFLECSV